MSLGRLAFVLLMSSIGDLSLYANQDTSNANRDPGCSGCHNNVATNTDFLRMGFSNGDAIVANAVYQIRVVAPAGITREGINIDAVGYTAGVSGAYVGSFVTDATGTTALAAASNTVDRRWNTSTGWIALNEATAGALENVDFFWKAPATGLPDGVKFQMVAVEGSGQGQAAPRVFANFSLGVTTSTPDDDDPDEDTGDPDQEASADENGAGGAGGSFGGDFGCARVILDAPSSQNSGLDLGLIFVLGMGLMGGVASYRSRKKFQKSRAKSS